MTITAAIPPIALVAFDRPVFLVALAAVPVALALAALSRQELGVARRGLSALLRALTLAVLAVAAAGPSLDRAGGPPGTAFLLDVSPSVHGAGRERLKKLQESLPRSERQIVLEFGAEPAAGPEGTDIAAAMRRAEAALGSGRIVLLTDGRETRGSARDEAARLRARGFVVDVVALPEKDPLDARVARVDLGGSEAREGEGLLIHVEVEATRPCSGEVTLTRDGESKRAWSVPVTLAAGGTKATLTFHDRAERRGVHRYEARVAVASDEEPANDSNGAVLLVHGGPRALVIELDPTDGEATSRVLTAQGFSVKRTSPDRAAPADLEGTDLAVLASGELTPDFGRALGAFVREGGGLLALGGARSYSGWRGTEIDDALPVTAEPNQTERPQVALVIAIDKSGSMRGPKLELAKLAARNAVWGLGKEDKLGVIAFNYNAYWIVPLETIVERTAVQAKIEMQAAGGGTDLMPSLREAKASLLPSNARVKHLLVLTDGIAGDGDAVCVYTAELAKLGITTSTVAVGEDADQGLLQRISSAGKGHHHDAARVSELPRIVLEETLVCARLAMEEEPFKIRRVRPHEALTGVELSGAPSLHGLNATKSKPLATVLLEGPRGLPLLATWEHGLGRAAAWTSDASPRWADQLLQHESFAKMFAQLARHLARRDASKDVEVELAASPCQEGVLLRAEARTRDGRFASDLPLEARVRSRDGEVARVPLALTAPGRYEATASVSSGSYLVEARLGQLTLATSGFARGATAERERIGADRPALEAIAKAGGGALDGAQLTAAEPPPPRREPVAPLLLAIAAVLLPLELAVRRARR